MLKGLRNSACSITYGFSQSAQIKMTAIVMGDHSVIIGCRNSYARKRQTICTRDSHNTIGEYKGHKGCPPVHFFSISCSFQENLAKIMGWCPHLWGWRPRLGNLGSTTKLYNTTVKAVLWHVSHIQTTSCLFLFLPLLQYKT